MQEAASNIAAATAAAPAAAPAAPAAAPAPADARGVSYGWAGDGLTAEVEATNGADGADEAGGGPDRERSERSRRASRVFTEQVRPKPHPNPAPCPLPQPLPRANPEQFGERARPASALNVSSHGLSHGPSDRFDGPLSLPPGPGPLLQRRGSAPGLLRTDSRDGAGGMEVQTRV